MTSNFIPRGADGYDSYMGRWSRRLAPLFLDFAGASDRQRVLDVGCGTGNLALALAAKEPNAAIEAIDFEEQFLARLRERDTAGRIKAQQGDACALPYPSQHFDRTLSMLVLHFVSDAHRATAEMRRVLRPGGVAAACVWDLYGGMPTVRIFWDTVAALQPSADERRGMSLFRSTTQPGELKNIFTSVGFVDVEEAVLTVRMDFESFDDYWIPLMSGQGNLPEFLAAMPQQVSDTIHARVRAAYLGNRPDGPRGFAAVAWAIRGVAPSS